MVGMVLKSLKKFVDYVALDSFKIKFLTHSYFIHSVLRQVNTTHCQSWQITLWSFQINLNGFKKTSSCVHICLSLNQSQWVFDWPCLLGLRIVKIKSVMFSWRPQFQLFSWYSMHMAQVSGYKQGRNQIRKLRKPLKTGKKFQYFLLLSSGSIF